MKMLRVSVLLLLPHIALADDVFLKGAGKVSGRIVSQTETQVQVDVGAGTITVPMSRVDRIVSGETALDDYARRAAAIGANDAAGWRGLGDWALSRGLNTQARQAYERAVSIDPTDASSNRALGRVQLDGQWVNEEESYRARGFVQFEGEWMTPAAKSAIESRRRQETQAAQQVREAETRAREAEARARNAEAEARDAEAGIPLYWGWGVGPSQWPGTYPVYPGVLLPGERSK